MENWLFGWEGLHLTVYSSQVMQWDRGSTVQYKLDPAGEDIKRDLGQSTVQFMQILLKSIAKCRVESLRLRNDGELVMTESFCYVPVNI